ncbi:MAG: orotate phosphoribosyltransferase [Calditrichia bacterium]
MDRAEALQVFESTGALQQGHFLLTSGLHSGQYFQCALVLQHSHLLERFCYEIYEYFMEEEPIDTVIAPAVGGIVVAVELARRFKCRAIFAERVDGKMTLRRGFRIKPGEKVLICEDVVTTGGSVKEVLELVEEQGGWPIGIGVVVDRSGGELEFDVPLHAVVETKAVVYEPDKCPLCREGKQLVKPGSRNLK